MVLSKKAGRLTGSPELTLKLDSLELGGRTYVLDSYPFRVTGRSKTQTTKTDATRGAEAGLVAGAATASGANGGGNPEGMLTDAAIGAGIGTLVSGASPGPGIWIPSES